MDRKRLTDEIRSIGADIKTLQRDVETRVWAIGDDRKVPYGGKYELLDKYARLDYKYTLFRNRLNQLLAELED